MNAKRKFGPITESKLARWFGEDVLDAMKLCAGGIRGKPVPIMGVPAGFYEGVVVPREALWFPGFEDDRVQGMTGFSSLSDLISEATTGGKLQELMFYKVGVTQPAVGASASLWNVGNWPAAGAAPAGAPGGTTPTRADTGALGQQNPGGTDTLHMTTCTITSTVAGALLVYDYLWGVAFTPAASTAITGTPNRYTGAAGTLDYAAGSFVSNLVTSALGNTAHNITYTYKDQDNNAAEAAAAITGRNSAALSTSDFTAPQWSMPLNGNDTGVRAITNIAFSANPTGTVMHFIGHPIALIPIPLASIAFVLDGINSAFNLMKIQTDAAIAFMEFFKSATTAATYSGEIKLVSG